MFNHEQRESIILKPFHKRLLYLLIVIFALFIVMIFRLSFLQIVNGDEHSIEATSKADKYIPIPANRGKIFPREGGTPIADNKSSETAVFTELEEMKMEDYVELATKLEKILNVKREEILAKMDVGFAFKLDKNGTYVLDEKGNPAIDKIPRYTARFLEKDLKMGLSDKEVAYISEHRTELPGIEAKSKNVRVYDPRLVAVQAIGYVRPYNVATTTSGFLYNFYYGKNNIYTPNQPVGYDGVEFTYEEYLRGVNGKKNFQISSDGSIQNYLKQEDPIAGNDLYLTIDSRMQVEVRDYIKGVLPSIRANSGAQGTRNVYAVAMEVKTGKIVSMVSFPEYDPNVWVTGVNNDVFEQIRYYVNNGTIQSAPYDVSPKKEQEAVDEIERHPTSIVPTGSTIKPLTVLMGLAEKAILPNDVWQDPAGGFRYAGSASDIVRNDKSHNYGTLTPQRALQKSANTYMARIALKIKEKYDIYAKKNYKDNPAIYIMQKYFHAFGLGVKTGVPLPNENAGVEDFITTNSTVSPLAAMVQSSFGQQERFTAMQLAQYMTTMANKGVRLQPQIVDKIVDKDGKVVKEFQPKVMSKITLPEEAWETVEQGMYAVTQGDGTASWVFSSFPYKFGAKTGTSDQDIYVPVKDAKGKVTGYKYDRSVANGVFVAYGPIEDPKLAVAIVVPEGGYGGLSCGTIAQQIFKSYDKYYGLGPAKNTASTK